MAYLVGIDIGTSGTKTLLVDPRGRIRASVTVEYPCYAPKPAWSEQVPEDWWQATVRSVRQALAAARVKGAEVGGVGLSGQMHGSVFLDRGGKVLRRAILWNDQRTGAECDEITRRAGGRAKLIAMVSNPALTGFTAPKILWVRKHEPRVYDRTTRILLPKDYVRYRLTDEFATEVSDSSGTLLLDVKRRRWSRKLLGLLDIDPALLPDVYESQEVSGRLTPAAAKATGLAAGTPVVGGGGDQAAGAVGNGIVRRGVISATLGTSGVVFAHADTVETDPKGRVHTFCHAVAGKWHVMGVVLAAGGSLQWFRNVLCQDLVKEARRRKVDPYELITADAAKVPPGSDGLYFLPYLTGERTPHADPNARAAWIGLSNMHTRAHMARAVIEGATYAMRDCLGIIQGMGVPVTEIRVSGGGAKSAFWRGLQADVYRQSVWTVASAEGPAYGVALLAGVGTGVWKSVPEACDATIRRLRQSKPNRRNVRTYDALYPEYGQLYRSLKDDFARMAGAAQG
ncbi:MAG TPA: xylulokinase [Phycisphaerae bacterium]|nr:xylulokinase [Phycisphaerae bacterium]